MFGGRGGAWAGLTLGVWALFAAPQAHADKLRAEQREGERGYVAVEELSFEAIVEADSGYSATLKLRTALHNSSLSMRDVVHAIGLPFVSEVEGVRVMKDGAWQDGAGTTVAAERSRRAPGSVFVRRISPRNRRDNPGAELVAYGLAADETLQVEISVRVYPRLRGDAWELDLPARGVGSLSLADERRVLVRGLKSGEGFTVDEESNEGRPAISSRAADTVTVSWPSQLRSTDALEVNVETEPGAPGFDDGSIRMYLRLGKDAAPQPKHVLFVVDRSKSTAKAHDRDVLGMANGLLDTLPANTTFDALAFNRTVTPLFPERSSFPRAGSPKDRTALHDALLAVPRDQGTDLEAAMSEAARRSREGRGQTLVVVATDGMFPSSISPDAVARGFEVALGGRKDRPEVVFVVDEPMLQRSGLHPTHPAARVAAKMGARISLESIAQLDGSQAGELLNTPRVLGNLAVELPPGVTLEDPVPEGLVAGSFVMLRGRYLDAAPKSIRVNGTLGPKQVTRKIKPTQTPHPADAFVATSRSPLDEAVREGFSAPPWYTARWDREARASIAQAGRFGRNKKRGFLDQKVFRHYLTTRVLPRARACYNDALTREPELSGRVVLEIEVGKGEVMMARVAERTLDGKDPKLDTCLTDAAWRLDAPAGVADRQIYRLRYPLRLLPPPEGKFSGSVTPLSDEVMELLLSQPLPGETRTR
ncbi:MAG: hypothetical protein ACRBN8_07505 [Nannocystales bacterium]